MCHVMLVVVFSEALALLAHVMPTVLQPATNPLLDAAAVAGDAHKVQQCLLGASAAQVSSWLRQPDAVGNTVLHIAAANGNEALIQLLTEAGVLWQDHTAALDLPNVQHHTPLMVAAITGAVSVCLGRGGVFGALLPAMHSAQKGVAWTVTRASGRSEATLGNIPLQVPLSDGGWSSTVHICCICSAVRGAVRQWLNMV